MRSLWNAYQITVDFAMVYAVFSLAVYASLWVGVFSLGTVTFGAAGGYLAARLVADMGIPIGAAIVAASLLGSSIALLASIPFLRLASHWIALATVALLLISRVLILNLPDLTGGVAGMSVPRRLSSLDLLVILLVTCYAFWRIRGSRFGIAADAVREDPPAAAALGIDPRGIQRVGFALSGGLGAVAGVMLANVLQFISPDTFYIHLALITIAAVVLGGMYHWTGPLIGAVIFVGLPELLRPFIRQADDVANGVVLLAIMLFLPRGIIDPRRWRIKASRDDGGADDEALLPNPKAQSTASSQRSADVDG